jgi:hypothetical protein
MWSKFEQLVEENPKGLGGNKWNMTLLSGNFYISAQFILDHPNGINGEQWVVAELYRRHFVSTLVLALPQGFDEPWDPKILVDSRYLKLSVISSFPDGINGVKWDVDKITNRREWMPESK